MFGEERGEMANAGAPVGVFGFGSMKEECEMGYCLEGRGGGRVDSKVFGV